MANNKQIAKVIENVARANGTVSVRAIQLNSSVNQQMAARFAEIDFSGYPAYLTDTVEQRVNPVELFPWAKSVVICAFPFIQIPRISQNEFIPEATDGIFSGKIAGYAVLQDYHKYGKEQLANIAENLRSHSDNCEVRTEICLDTAPVAEKILAEISGLGRRGMNSCILVKGYGSGCFLGEIFTNLDVGELLMEPSSGVNDCCEKCLICVSSCPTGALSYDRAFECSKCRSHITMEKRGLLSPEESRLLGDWIFGCDMCTANCPGTELPPAYNADLRWILRCSSSDLKRAIRGTALEYAGPTLLRRNALAVLANKNTVETRAEIAYFAKKTGSELLRETARRLTGQSVNR